MVAQSWGAEGKLEAGWGGLSEGSKAACLHHRWRKGQVSLSCPSGRRPPSDRDGSAWRQCLTLMSSLGGTVAFFVPSPRSKKEEKETHSASCVAAVFFG